jgi:hypothetical protein
MPPTGLTPAAWTPVAGVHDGQIRDVRLTLG